MIKMMKKTTMRRPEGIGGQPCVSHTGLQHRKPAESRPVPATNPLFLEKRRVVSVPSRPFGPRKPRPKQAAPSRRHGYATPKRLKRWRLNGPNHSLLANVFRVPTPFSRQTDTELTMQPLKIRTLLILGVFFTFAHADFQLRALTSSDGVLSSSYSDSVLLSSPPCRLGGNRVTLQFQNMATNMNTTMNNIFLVPACRTRRDTILIPNNAGQSASSFLGYQVNGLTNGTMYRFQYTVGQEKSNVLDISTLSVSPYTSIYDGLPARSGAMVVITVILSITMFLLVVGLVVTLFLSHCRQ
ncbi:uroplakin-2 [Arapaima gigas]